MSKVHSVTEDRGVAPPRSGMAVKKNVLNGIFDASTPGHFLVGRPITAISESSLTEVSDNRLKVWQKQTKIVEQIWKRWSNNYLSTLQNRYKWYFEKNNAKINYMVIMNEDNLPVCNWPLGRILEVYHVSPFTVLKHPFLKKGASDENMLDSDEELWENSTSSSPGPVSKVEFKDSTFNTLNNVPVWGIRWPREGTKFRRVPLVSYSRPTLYCVVPYSLQVGNIGTFTDHDVALKYCTRLLCSSFLLTGTPGYCIPDRNVRISVKSLALGCLSSIFSLYPNGFLLPLHLNNGSTDNNNIGKLH
ncbi:huntingtin [Trichonephila clavipes]|nr:huntingtin [Trichonephila clavipes]